MTRNLFIIFLIVGCCSFAGIIGTQQDERVYIEASPQRSGDAGKGYEYLVTGDYVKSGIPYDFYLLGAGKARKSWIKREGLNANVSYDYTVVKAANGENLVAPNCLQCHAQVFDSTLFIGLGNSMIDFTANEKMNTGTLTMLSNMIKSSSPQKFEASKAFLDVTKTIGPFLTTKVRGVNAANRLTAVLVAHRDPSSFKWNEIAGMDIPEEVVPTDTPAWWLLKKKHAMFYTGLGRGDFGRFLMASNLLTVTDTAESREVDSHISDVLAYINNIQSPKYPREINRSLAKSGEALFIKNCSKCHGKYGEDEKYPNFLIRGSVIGTDSLLFKSNMQNPQFVNWFNKSWFTTGDHPARIEASNGYIAPPLDGVWITAPYLHNGSVPDLESLLNSDQRPRYWKRNFNQPTYDYQKVGWQYQSQSQPGDNTVYNTDLAGYGNYGHEFGDKLSEKQRKSVIEYLKTL